jgi:hypothetical protein
MRAGGPPTHLMDGYPLVTKTKASLSRRNTCANDNKRFHSVLYGFTGLPTSAPFRVVKAGSYAEGLTDGHMTCRPGIFAA